MHQICCTGALGEVAVEVSLQLVVKLLFLPGKELKSSWGGSLATLSVKSNPFGFKI
jgi:hypothetical protein